MSLLFPNKLDNSLYTTFNMDPVLLERIHYTSHERMTKAFDR